MGPDTIMNNAVRKYQCQMLYFPLHLNAYINIPEDTIPTAISNIQGILSEKVGGIYDLKAMVV